MLQRRWLGADTTRVRVARILLATPALLFLAAGVAGGALSGGEEPPADVSSAAPPLRSAWADRAAPVRAPRSPAARARRPRTLPIGLTPRGAVRRAYLAGRIARDDYAAWRRADRAARAALARLRGSRRAELAAVVRALDTLAAQRRLTASRMPLAFLTLRRNTGWWRSERSIAPRGRVTFGRDPAIFQWYPGHGLQHHALAGFGRVNALAIACHRGRKHCRPRALRKATDRLVELSSRRDGGFAWEGLFAFGGAQPPWVSGLTQGTAAQALARAASVLRDGDYKAVALGALRPFELPPPAGVAVPAGGGGAYYAMYSSNASLQILNGHLQAVIGLHDLWRATGDRRAKRLYERGERAAAAMVGGYDTGAWSLYSRGGGESSLGYHRLVTNFLAGLCGRTKRGAYCAPARRFARYRREPPRLALALVPRPRAGSAAPLRFRLSKQADVSLTVWSPKRGIVLRRRGHYGRGHHTIAFAPPRRGRLRVAVAARGLSGPVGHARATIRVRPSLAEVRRARARRAARRAAARRRAIARRKRQLARYGP